jgi:type I restriction enzyme, S subunit
MTDLITDHMDIWTGAQIQKANGGRGRGKNGNGQSIYGIKKLRELILELAVRGKLVPQDPDDEPASVLLDRIAEEKKRLIKEGKIKKQKELPEIGEDEKPFELPDGWNWDRLQNLYYSISPSEKKLNKSSINDTGRYPVISQGKAYIEGYSDEVKLLLTIPGPVIIFGDHTTERKYIDFDFIPGADGTKILRPYRLDEKYFHMYLLNYKLENRGYARHFKVLNDNLFAIPPLPEQHRIVAKVDELMALCDQLEQQQTDNNATHQTLVETLLTSLTAASDPKDFDECWQRIANHFDTLFTTEQSIDHLKQTILQLAVMGRLVPQNPDDEPASVLLEKIAKEKARLVKEGKIKKQKKLAEIGEGGKPFELPEGWEWVTLDSIVDITSGVTKGRKISNRVCISVPYLRVANVQRGFLDLDLIKEIDLPEVELQKFTVVERDLLITEGGDWDKVGRTAIWGGQIPMIVHQNHIFKARCILKEQNEVWLEKYLNSQLAREYFASSSKQTTNLASINKTQLRGGIVAIPPPAEQHRIVAKVDELITICDTLKTRLNDAQTTQVQLADATAEQAVG